MMVMRSRVMHHPVHPAIPHRHHCSMGSGCRIIRPDLQSGQTLKGGTRGFIRKRLTLKCELPKQSQQNADYQQPTTYRG